MICVDDYGFSVLYSDFGYHWKDSCMSLKVFILNVSVNCIACGKRCYLIFIVRLLLCIKFIYCNIQ